MENEPRFEHAWPSDPSVVLFHVCYWIDHWSNLQVQEEAKLELQQGAKLLEQVASEVFRDRRRWAPWVSKLDGEDGVKKTDGWEEYGISEIEAV